LLYLKRAASKDKAVACYALEVLSNKVMAAEYQMTLPDAELLAAELERTRKILETRVPNRLDPRSPD
jgi:DnaJ-domain-containing protein 1